MWYAIISEDHNNSLPLRKIHRPAHLQRLQLLDTEKRLLLAGPHPAADSDEPAEAGFSGSLVVAAFDSLQLAQAWADADPYLLNGVYRQIVVKPFIKVLP